SPVPMGCRMPGRQISQRRRAFACVRLDSRRSAGKSRCRARGLTRVMTARYVRTPLSRRLGAAGVLAITTTLMAGPALAAEGGPSSPEFVLVRQRVLLIFLGRV